MEGLIPHIYCKVSDEARPFWLRSMAKTGVKWGEHVRIDWDTRDFICLGKQLMFGKRYNTLSFSRDRWGNMRLTVVPHLMEPEMAKRVTLKEFLLAVKKLNGTT